MQGPYPPRTIKVADAERLGEGSFETENWNHLHAETGIPVLVNYRDKGDH